MCRTQGDSQFTTPKATEMRGHVLENKCSSHLTTRKLATNFGMSEKTVRSCLKSAGIKKRKAQNALAYKDTQVSRCKRAAGRILQMRTGRIIIMDDESYVFQDPSETPANHGIAESMGTQCPTKPASGRATISAQSFLFGEQSPEKFPAVHHKGHNEWI
jgi:hypothetical protein